MLLGFYYGILKNKSKSIIINPGHSTRKTFGRSNRIWAVLREYSRSIACKGFQAEFSISFLISGINR